VYLLASKAGFNSGKALAKLLNLKFHSNVNKIKDQSEILIRYGNYQDSGRIVKDTCINSVDAILKCSAKHLLSKFLAVDPELLSPIYYPYCYNNILPNNLTFPVMARKRHHKAGNDIVICNKYDDIPSDANYLVDIYPTSREYRVHVFNGEVVKVFRKYPIDDNADPLIRSSHHGWKYVRSNLSKVLCAKSLIKTAVKVADILGVVFCGIDMAWSIKKELNRWIIWEVNSAPSLNSSSLELYAELFRNFFQENREATNVFHRSKNNNERSCSINSLS